MKTTIFLLLFCSLAYAQEDREVDIKKLQEELQQFEAELDMVEEQVDDSAEQAIPAGVIDIESSEQIPSLAEPTISGAELAISPLKAIPPVRGGVENDSGFLSLVTSEIGWISSSPSQCGGPLVASELCKKSLSLKEVLARFSGTDAFYENLCESACENGVPVLTGLTLPQESATSLRAIWNGRRCVYRINKSSDNWKAMILEGAVCRCVSKSCENNS